MNPIPDSIADSPEAALREVLRQCDGNITRLAGMFTPKLTPAAIHRWLRAGHVPAANAPQLERISRDRVEQLGLPSWQIVLCEYLCPDEPWEVLRANPLTGGQRVLVEAAKAHAAERAGEAQAAAEA